MIAITRDSGDMQQVQVFSISPGFSPRNFFVSKAKIKWSRKCT